MEHLSFEPFRKFYIENEFGQRHFVNIGEDVSEALGITKYVPEIPSSMSGEVVYVPNGPVKYDFESIQKLTDLFDHGEEVVASEKLHGSFVSIGIVPDLGNSECFSDGQVYVCSKGLGGKGLCFKDVPANDSNLYVRAMRTLDVEVVKAKALELSQGQPVRLFGEVFGPGVQDLSYGLTRTSLRLFDIMVGTDYLGHDAMVDFAADLGFDTVPILYRGAYDLDQLVLVRDGRDTISGTHVREGIVIKTVREARHPIHGRKIGKFVSPDYLLRKNGTEFA